MMRRTPPALALATIAVAMLATGCTPTPEPTPTPTGFASEEEAFAAAEETYRAYVDAGNRIDLSDPSTFEPLFALTTGDANSADRRQFSEMHAEGYTLSGQSSVTLVSPTAYENAQAELAVCLDVSEVDVVDESGNSVVSEGRSDVQAMAILLDQSVDGPNGWLISSFGAREGEPVC